MGVLKYRNKVIFYEVFGEGKPIILLNGIMMSTKSWQPFIKSLSDLNKLIMLDFFDQGQSEKMEDNVYSQDEQVNIVKSLLDELNIEKISIVGISYGGEIATLFAIKFPEFVERLILFNTTTYTSPWLAKIGEQWNAIGKTRDGSTYYKATIPVIYSASFYEANLDWMEKREKLLIPVFSNPEFLDSMERLTKSAETYDVRKNLSKITAQTLIISSDEDYLTPIANQVELNRLINKSNHVILPGTGHASMYEKPLLFVTLILGFVNVVETYFEI